MTEDYQRRLQEAEVLMNGSDVQKQKGMEILKKIVQETNGTLWATKAMEVIGKHSSNNLQIKREAEQTAYAWRWRQIVGLSDVRLVSLLKDLKARPNIAARLRADVLPAIRSWVEDVMPKVRAMKPRELSAIERFINAVSEIEAYKVDEIKQLRNVIFGVRLNRVSQKIVSALEEWSIEEAWRLFAELNNAPEGFQSEISRLQESIYKVDGVRKSVQELLEQSPKSDPGEWLEVRIICDSLQKTQDLINSSRIPPAWQARLKEKTESYAAVAVSFMKKQAAAVSNLEDLMAFWTEYQRLNTTASGGRLSLEERWFDNYRSHVLSIEGNKVAGAKSPEELKAIGTKMGEEARAIPQFAIDQMESLVSEITRAVSNWKLMQCGGAFEDPSSLQNLLPVPDELIKEAKESRELLDKVQDAFLNIKANGSFPSEQTYNQALQVAEQVLAKAPNHKRAGELKQEAEFGILHYQLDAALAGFNFEMFFKLCETDRVGGNYYDLARTPDAMRGLAALASEGELSIWLQAADWWSRWRAACKLLPENLPKSLEGAIKNQERLRADQWYDVLERLQSRELTPEEYEATAESLESEMEELSLHGFYKELIRKAKTGLVRRFIEMKEFEKAAAELANPDLDHNDTIRLRTRLELEKAIESGVSATAEVLRNKWNNVEDAYSGKAYAVLLEAVRKAWEEDKPETLKKLRDVINRVISVQNATSDDVEMLKQWEVWLNLEDTIKSGASRLGVNNLVDYLKQASREERTLSQRLERLVSYWQANGDIKMLAWAYQAFKPIDPHIMPGAYDPAEDMTERSGKLAEKVLNVLQTKDDLTISDLLAIRKEVKDEEDEWNDLNDLYSLARPITPRKPPGKFDSVSKRLERLIDVITTIERLESADLREEASRDRLDSVLMALKKEFEGFAIKPKLLTQASRLEHLTKLEVVEKHIVEAAEKCGSESLTDLFNTECFLDLKKSIEELIEKFTLAELEKAAMWEKLSQQYCQEVYEKAGILTPKIVPPDLRSLADCVDRLWKEDIAFEKAIDELKKNEPPVPVGGVFDPKQHLDYLSHFPKNPPGSKRVERRFYRFASAKTVQTILSQSRAYIREWVQKYL
jgi:hypothetical protein